MQPDGAAAEAGLALELYEAIDTVPKVLWRVRRVLEDPETPSGFDLKRFETAHSAYNRSIGKIRADQRFTDTLRTVRNTVAAHHQHRDTGMENGIAWALASWRNAQANRTTLDSKTAEYAIRLDLAVIQLGQDISSSESTDVPRA